MQTKTNKWILAVLIAIPLVIFIMSGVNSERIKEDKDTMYSPAEVVNERISDTMPLGRTMRQIGLQLRYNTGETKQQDIFISSNGLMKDIEPVDEERMRNTHSTISTISEYARDMDISVYLTVLPTASAVLQQNLPLFFSTVNQKNIIDDIYNQFSGTLITVNSYNTLLENRDKYIYYRTENNLTPLGGYYVYQDLIRRMWVFDEALSQNDFSIEYKGSFYGELFEAVPYDKVKPDTIMVYQRKNTKVTHEVEKIVERKSSYYNTLYPERTKESKSSLDTYMGGSKGVTDITTSHTYPANLLVLADDTFLSYVPFLTNHYERITVVNLFEEDSNLDTIQFKNYDQILFAFDVENYTNKLDLSALIEVMENQRNE